MPERTCAVEVHELTKKFGDFTAVDGVTFTVQPGEIFGFLGPNGAGKTTTIRMLSGLLEPTSGDACVAGLDILTETEAVKQRIGYMSQLFSLYGDLTVDENIDFFAGLYGVKNRRLEARRRSSRAPVTPYSPAKNAMFSSTVRSPYSETSCDM